MIKIDKLKIVFNLIKTNEIYNLIYFTLTLIIALLFIGTVVWKFLDKKFSKSYVSEMTGVVNKRKGNK